MCEREKKEGQAGSVAGGVVCGPSVREKTKKLG